ncbi:MAG: ATP-binding protein [Lachnospiraceae bacterium]
MKVQTIVLYRNLITAEPVFQKFYRVMTENMTEEEKESLFYDGLHDLVELAQEKSFAGNLWHLYLTYFIASDVNAYSMACEKKGAVSGSIREIARKDFAVMKQLFEYDWGCFASLLDDFQPAQIKGIVLNKLLRDRMNELSVQLEHAESVEEFQEHIEQFYHDFGVGKYGLHKSFRIRESHKHTTIVPITNSENIVLDDLVGYESQKQQLIDNTEAFLAGKKANNVLLFGESGTGKSSSIKAILNEYFPKGLRMIEIFKHQFGDLNRVIEEIKNRNYKFIIYMDDLSFEESELEYKYLKAVIEGGLEKWPDNVLIYATSNRRHLVKETWGDRRQSVDDVHGNDSQQEKLSLYARFGVSIYYGSPAQEQFFEIVDTLAERRRLNLDQESIHQAAVRWELQHGGFSGRAAEQVITHLLAKYGTREV